MTSARAIVLGFCCALLLGGAFGGTIASSIASNLGFTDGSQPLGSKATTSGDVLTWNGSAWSRATITGAGALPLTGGTGIVSQTSPTATAARTITAGSGITVSNGNGVSGNPTISAAAGQQAVWPASGVSAESVHEVVRGLDGAQYLQLKRSTTYTTARVSALTGSEWGRTWVNGANLDGADQDTTTSDGFYWDHDATNTDWVSGGVTAPYYYHSLTLNAGDRLVYTVRVSCNGDANYELFGIFAAEASAPQTNYVHLRAGYNTATGIHRDASSGPTLVSVSATGTQLTNGVWMRLIIDDGGIHTFYNLTNQATPPTGAWTRIGGSVRGAMTNATAANWWTNAIRVGLSMITVNASNNFTGSVLYEDMQFEPGEAGRTGIQWGAMLLDTSGTAQSLGEYNFGAAVTLDQTLVRQILADASNARPGDTATITWSVTGSATPSFACGSFAAAGAVTVTGPYQYWEVCGKITSATGAEQGSIRLPLALPVAP